jgi:hypothetical protein
MRYVTWRYDSLTDCKPAHALSKERPCALDLSKYFAGAVYPSRSTELACYWDILNQLATQADPPIASALSIEQMRWEL